MGMLYLFTCCREGGEKHVLVGCLQLGHRNYKINKFNTSVEEIYVSGIS